MARTASTMVALGTAAPDFRLPDVVSHRMVSRNDFADKKALLVMFICRHCPFVIHVQNQLARIGRDYGDRVGIVAISSNDIEAYPEDAPESLAEQARDVGFTFPYLYDGTQSVARAYDAVCTPDLFLFGPKRALVYRGQLDDSRPSNTLAVTGEDLRAALDAVLAGRRVSEPQRPSIGCNIKWKPAPAGA
jgi:peroxiredoxin